MQISKTGLELIKQHEGLKLKAYRCPAGVLTIGYGHTHGVKLNDVITAEQAEKFLREDLLVAELTINTNVKVRLTQGQFDALVSFVFNLGAKKFVGSTLLRKLNAGDYSGAANELERWVYAGKKILPGLIKRRADERQLFLS